MKFIFDLCYEPALRLLDELSKNEEEFLNNDTEFSRLGLDKNLTSKAFNNIDSLSSNELSDRVKEILNTLKRSTVKDEGFF